MSTEFVILIVVGLVAFVVLYLKKHPSAGLASQLTAVENGIHARLNMSAPPVDHAAVVTAALNGAQAVVAAAAAPAATSAPAPAPATVATAPAAPATPSESITDRLFPSAARQHTVFDPALGPEAFAALRAQVGPAMPIYSPRGYELSAGGVEIVPTPIDPNRKPNIAKGEHVWGHFTDAGQSITSDPFTIPAGTTSVEFAMSWGAENGEVDVILDGYGLVYERAYSDIPAGSYTVTQRSREVTRGRGSNSCVDVHLTPFPA